MCKPAIKLFICLVFTFAALTGCVWINGPELSAPDGVAATVDELDKIILTWNAAENADIYYIYRSGSETGEYIYRGFTYGPEFTDTDIGHEVAYWYAVTASDIESNNESGYSDKVMGNSLHNFSWSPAVAADGAAQARLALDPVTGSLYLAGVSASDGGAVTVSVYNADDAAWDALGAPFGNTDTSRPRIAAVCAWDGTVYCAYGDAGLGNTVTVKKYSGGSWSSLGPISGSTGAAYLSMAADPVSGTVYLGFVNGSGAEVAIIYSSADDFTNVEPSLPSTGPDGTYTSLVIDRIQGSTYYAYEDNDDTLPSFPAVAASWTGTAAESGNDMRDNYLDLLAVSATELYLLYFTEELHLLRYTGGASASWAEIPLPAGSAPSTTINTAALAYSGGDLYLFYRDGTGGKVLLYSDSSWTVVTEADQDTDTVIGLAPSSLDLEVYDNDIYASYVSAGTAQMRVWE